VFSTISEHLLTVIEGMRREQLETNRLVKTLVARGASDAAGILALPEGIMFPVRDTEAMEKLNGVLENSESFSSVVSML